MDPRDAPEPGHSSTRDRIQVAALYALATVIYAVLGHRMPVPMVSHDEYTYGHLAQSIAHGEGLSWRGQSQPLRAALYIVVIAPAWLLGSTVTGYAVAKVLGAALVCSVVLPTWWLARQVVGQRVAVLTAAVTVAGASMVVAGEILTENLAYPLATVALAVTVIALREPARRWGWIALTFALAAAASRAQLVALVPLILAAVLVDAVRRGRDWRSALTAQRRFVIATAGLTIVGGAFALIDRATVLGSYSGIRTGPPATRIAAAMGHQLVGLVTSAGIIPATVALAVSTRRDAWRDPWLGPLLAVLWSATVVFVTESAWAVAGFDTPWHIERYVMYVLPLLFLAMVAGIARGYADRRRLTVTTVLLAAAMLLAPEVREVEEELTTYAVFDIGDAVLGASTAVSLALATLLTGGAATIVATGRGAAAAASRAATLAGVCVLALAVLAVPAWTWKVDVSRGWRAIFPQDLAWVDHHAHTPLARLIGAANASVFEVGEFFNRNIRQTFVPETPIGGRVVRGRTCVWHAGPDGTLAVDGGCGPLPSRFYLDDFYAKFTFYDQRVELDDPPVARIVAIPAPARPRLRAIFYPVCGPPLPVFAVGGRGPTVGPERRACPVTTAGARFWLDAPATLVLRWRGGAFDEQVAIGQHTYAIPAHRPTAVRLRIPARPVSFPIRLSWSGSPPLAPELVAAQLVDQATTTDLLY